VLLASLQHPHLQKGKKKKKKKGKERKGKKRKEISARVFPATATPRSTVASVVRNGVLFAAGPFARRGCDHELELLLRSDGRHGRYGRYGRDLGLDGAGDAYHALPLAWA